MRRFSFILFFFAFIPSFSQTAVSPEQAIQTLEGNLIDAIGSRNHDVLMNLYDDQYHGVLASGHTVDKIKMVEFLETSSPHILVGVEDLKVTIYGTMAVTTGKIVSRSKSGSVIGQSRFIRVYLKKGDQWKIIESQGTVIIQE